MRILVVDNHDSFVFNLVQYVRELGARCTVLDRADVTPQAVRDAAGVLLSPGPGHPADTGVCLDAVAEAEARRVPLLGVCLGLQVIAHVHGAAVGRAPAPVHGYASRIHHAGAGVFRGLPETFLATRYHSLAVDAGTVPPALEVTAWTGDGVVMGLRHRSLPVEGVQFHPESVLSECGHALLANWLEGCALKV